MATELVETAVVPPTFPDHCNTVGKKVAFISGELLPQKRFEEYLVLMGEVLGEHVHYVDPVHEMHGRDDVLAMLAKYVPRAANDKFQFELLVDEPHQAVWRWTMVIVIKFGNYEFVIHGLVHARIENDKIVYQREFYDPMESIGIIPLVGRLYRRMLRSA